MKRRRRKLPLKACDPRVNAPMISWHIIFVVLGVVSLLVAAQTVLITYYLSNRIGAMVAALTAYLVFVCLVIAGIIWLVWRHTTGKPLRRIARAARQVAAGDFSVQVAPAHQNGKMNEIDVLIADFNTMTRELAGNEMLKSDFIANVSHEIKTPLAVIQSYAKALRDGCVPPEQREAYLDTVAEAAGRLNAMIANVLKLSKLENQQIFPAPHTYQLGEQLRRCALNFMEQWQAKDIDFAIDVADVAVCCDADLLELVWNNLLSNAVKYTGPGGRILLTSRVEGGAVAVTVQDTGCGMDAETSRRAFEKFYQGDPSHASQGNGLGLALAKKVVDLAGGRIWVKSAPGRGSAFTVELPVAAG